MKKEVTLKEDMAAFYRNAGKKIWFYFGLLKNKVLSIKKDSAIIMCETDAEYSVLVEDGHFFSIAKKMEYDYRCATTLGRANCRKEKMGISCSVCLFKDDENKAREMFKKAIMKLSEDSKIDCDGL